jgi:amino acid adenylation domain-containing protein
LNQASLVLELPLDKPRPAVPTFRGALQTLELSPELSQALKRLSRQEDATLFMTLLAAFYVLLSRYTGQDDILIGSPIANRTRTETEHLAGCFLNTLVLRARLTCEMTFRELLLQVRRVALEAYAHQELPVEKLIEELHPERDLHRNPLFQVLFTFLDASPRPFTLPDMTIELCDAENHRAKLDLSLTAVERNSQLVLSFEYNTDLFYNATVVRMLEHFQVLLKEIVAEPEKRLSALTLMSTHELIALLTRWNTTRKPLRNVGFSALFEAQAEQTPDAIAIVCGDEQLTYAELKQRANQLAHHLSKQGVGTDICVALLLDRSIHFSMGILAIFKAGGAFLPLDPLHPIQRHLQVVEQSHCRFLLTQKKHGQRFTTAWQKPGTDQSQSLSILDIEVLLQASAPQQSIALPDTPGNLAYIMYTSGSTGRPKGVMVEQIGMINHIYAKISDLQLGKEDVVAQNGPPGFDIVVWQCLAALLVGGRVHIFTDDVADNPARLLDCIEKEKITILQCVPSILRAIIQQAHAAGSNRPALAALRWLVPTGDALVPELCRRWLELYPTIPLLNTYGSTECSDDQCHYALQESPDLDYPLPIVPIGYPVQNMQAYVLDRWLQPVPVGVIGDLYIGGTGVGRGYLDDPARTAEFFLPHPFSAEPGARLYRTRDRTRYLPDGSLQFLSRSDHLIKVHGVRIEPGEIETVLARHPSVEEALVLARAATDGSKRLVAYIASSEKQAAFSDELRAFLRQELPEAMIPGQFVVLAAFPLNSNGKVDRQALPLPEQQRESRRAPYETFRTEMEHTITDIWQAILQQEHIGMRDNFFDLGGNSLHMAQVYNRLREDLQRDLSILDLFKYPTIATLAEYLQQGSTERQYVHVQDRARKQKEAMRRRKREISLE